MKYANSLLFKISGNGYRRPSWIFGTIHMLCAKDFNIKDKVLHALNKCSHYYMEVDLGNNDEINLMKSQPETSGNFLENLTDEEREEMNQLLTDEFGTNVNEVGDLPGIALVNKMTTEAMGCDDFKMMETELLLEAHKGGIATGGLETASFQVKIAKEVFTGKELLFQLKSSGHYKDMFPKMIRAYQREDLSQLANFVNDQKVMSEKAYKVLVKDRNKRWSRQIPQLMTQGSIFVAIGAGHLPGEDGIIHALRQQGLRVNPVYR